MAKITQALTRASKEYDQRTLQSLIRDLDGVINKLLAIVQIGDMILLLKAAESAIKVENL